MPNLTLTPKIRNSPLLAVKKFIQRHMVFYNHHFYSKNDNEIITTQKLWNKFKMNDEFKTVIDNFDIDFITFKELAEPILDTYCIGKFKIGPLNNFNFENKFNNVQSVLSF